MAFPAVPIVIIKQIPRLLGGSTSCQLPTTNFGEEAGSKLQVPNTIAGGGERKREEGGGRDCDSAE